MSVAVRFAPSPTGNLHIGNARTAVLNWLFARKHKGHFLLRLDDTDTERSKPEYIENLYEDLKWLGLDYEQFVRQSDRLERYREGQTKLIEAGYLYPCYETPEELERKRKVQLARKAPPIYDRAALSATQEQINQWKKEGRRQYWRFQLQEGIVSWNDFFKGALSFDLCNSVSDPVLVKEDGSFLYTLSSVIDDLDFNISHIIRGEDHVTNTGVQIQLINALGGQAENIIFAHLSLLLDQDGTPFSKRLQSFSLRNLRHMDPMAINCFLAGIGSNVSPYITDNVHDLAEHFSLENIRGGARVEEKSLYNIQKKIIRKNHRQC